MQVITGTSRLHSTSSAGREVQMVRDAKFRLDCIVRPWIRRTVLILVALFVLFGLFGYLALPSIIKPDGADQLGQPGAKPGRVEFALK